MTLKLHKQDQKKQRVIVQLVGGPAHGVTLYAPPCYPCAECHGVIKVAGPGSPCGVYYRARPEDLSRADFLPGGRQGRIMR